MWLPIALLAVGFVLAMGFGSLSAGIQDSAIVYFRFFFAPSALFTYLLGGALAPRASWLVGIVLGGLTGVLWIGVVGVNVAGSTDLVSTSSDLITTFGAVLLIALVTGLVVASLAGAIRYSVVYLVNQSRTR